MRLVKSLLQNNHPAVFTALLLLLGGMRFAECRISLGGMGGAFLRYPVGAAAFSKGGAGTAEPEYACAFWNPAALGGCKEVRLFMGSGYRMLGRTEGFTGVEFPIPPRVGISFAALYRGDPFLDGLMDEDENPLETGSYTALMLKMGCAYIISHALSAGFGLSILYQRLPTDFDRQGKLHYGSVTKLGALDVGMRYRPNKRIVFGVVVKNLLASFNWEFNQNEGMLNPVAKDTLPCPVVLGQQTTFTFLQRPLIFSSDCSVYGFNAYLRPLSHVEAVLNNGVQWRGWDNLSLSAGVRDLLFTRDMLYHPHRYRKFFTLAASLGIGVTVPRVPGTRLFRCNYGIATDKLGAGVDQQLDVMILL